MKFIFKLLTLIGRPMKCKVNFLKDMTKPIVEGVQEYFSSCNLIGQKKGLKKHVCKVE